MDVREFFGKNAEKYANSKSHAKGKDLEILINLLDPGNGSYAIDLAAGTGFTAIALAKKVGHVVAYDLTSEMLDEARKLAKNEGAGNVEFRNGDVADLPFEDSHFDIATCRRAAHHFKDKMAFLIEVKRVLKNGGKLGLVDMAAPENDPKDLFNRLERIRDSSHVKAESVSSWESLVKESGLKEGKVEIMVERITLASWLYPIAPDSEEGRKCRELVDSNLEDFTKAVEYDPKDDSFAKRRFILIAEKPL